MKHLVILATMAAALAFATPSSATSYSTDQSDLWFIPAESGWGIQFVQRGSLIFATMFVYDQSEKPTWFVATMSPTPGNGLVWTGDLYLTHGSFYGQPFNTGAFGGAIVGNMTWSPQNVAQGILTYSVNGIAVAKTISRQPIVNENYSGRYAGAIHNDLSGCTNAGNNGSREDSAIVVATQGATTLSFSVQTATDTCVYSGPLMQEGQLGEVGGSFTCTSGQNGGVDLFDLQVTAVAISGRFSASNATLGCQSTGWFGGARLVNP